MDEKLATQVMQGLKDMDRPIGRLMEYAKSLAGSDKQLIEISGEMLKIQFDLMERISKCFPDLDAE
jgi:hypothetical protein